MQRTKGYDPEPFDVPPIFQSPPRPVAMVRWTVTRFLWPQSLLWIAIGVLVYQVFTPGLGRFATLGIDDVELAADQFCELSRAGFHARQLFGMEGPPDPAQIARVVDFGLGRGVNFLLLVAA